MIAKTLSFGSLGKLSLRYEQLVWSGADGTERTFPIEDLGLVVLESGLVTITAAALQALAAQNVAVVLCDAAHQPTAQLVSFAGHTNTAEVTEAQIRATEAVQGRIWRQFCRAKILNQAKLVQRLQASEESAQRLKALAEAVKNGDPTNCEAQAARLYFQTLGPEGWTREREGDWPNAPLNYGYAILRAATARALVGSGLWCLWGMHHHNRYNAFALADDVMEPYRPFVDQYVLGKLRPFDVPMKELTRDMKVRLLEMLTCDVKIGETHRPLQVALSFTTASLARYYKGESTDLALPTFL